MLSLTDNSPTKAPIAMTTSKSWPDPDPTDMADKHLVIKSKAELSPVRGRGCYQAKHSEQHPLSDSSPTLAGWSALVLRAE